MPLLIDWVDPDLAFRLRDGRPVFHCYRENRTSLTESNLLQYHYTIGGTVDDEESEEYVVDFRDYLGQMPWGNGHPKFPVAEDYVDEIAIAMCVLQRAVDEGLIWPRGEPRID